MKDSFVFSVTVYTAVAAIVFLAYAIETEEFPESAARGVLWPAYAVRALVRIVIRDFYKES